MNVLELSQWLVRTPYARLALVGCFVVGLLFAPSLARWRGSSAWGSSVWGWRLSIWGLGLALVPTIVNRINVREAHFAGIYECRVLLRGATSAEGFLNLFLLVPLAVGLVLLTRQLWLAIVAVSVLVLSIEIVQQVVQIGGCEVDDIVRNIGGAAAAALGTYWLVRRRPSASTLPTVPKQIGPGAHSESGRPRV